MEAPRRRKLRKKIPEPPKKKGTTKVVGDIVAKGMTTPKATGESPLAIATRGRPTIADGLQDSKD